MMLCYVVNAVISAVHLYNYISLNVEAFKVELHVVHQNLQIQLETVTLLYCIVSVCLFPVSWSCCCVFRYLSASATLDDIAQSEAWVDPFLFCVLVLFL